MNPNTVSALRRSRSRSPFVILGLALLVPAIPAGAQSVMPSPGATPNNGGADEEILEMSPFVVRSEATEGYQATTTLAGTRLKTDLKDVASAISVYTPQFLEDVGAIDTKDLLVYTTGTEVAGMGGTISNTSEAGNFGVDFAGERFVSTSTTRVRGLAAADNTRGGYATDVPLDAYNTDRVTMNRGANSILFGLGSPAGIIDTTLAMPMSRNATELTTRFDGHGSLRTSLDINRVLVKNKLNARLGALHDWREFEQKPAFDKIRRLYAAVEARPFENTRIRANVEFGDRDGSPEMLAPPRDRLTEWWKYGKPTTLLGLGVGTVPVSSLNAGAARGAYLFYDNGATSAPPFGQLALPSGIGLVSVILKPSDPVYNLVDAAARNNYAPQYVTMDDPVRIEGRALPDHPVINPARALGRSTQILDRSVYDYETNLLTGRNDRRSNRFGTVNVALEQTFLERQIGAEIAIDHQKFRSATIDLISGGAFTRSLGIDLTERRYDGSINPNFGRAIVIGAPNWREDETERDVFRITTFGTFDARSKLGERWRWLGKHLVTGLYDRSKAESRNIRGSTFGFPQEMGNLIGYQAANNLINQELRGSVMFHVGPSLLNASSPANAHIGRLPDHIFMPQQAIITHPVKATRSITTGSYPLYTYPDDKAILTGQAGLSATKSDSLALALQSKWWNDKLVGTFGWRQDSFKSFNAGAAPQDSLGSRMVGPSDFYLPDSPEIDVKENSWSTGLVLHAPAAIKRKLPWGMDFSLSYATSENFSPTAAVRNPFGGFFSSPSGETKDYGATVSFLDNRIVARYTTYKTSQKNLPDNRMAGIYVWFFNNIPDQIFANNTTAAIAAAGFELPDPRIQEALGWQFVTGSDGSKTLTWELQASDVVDAISEGDEFEVVGKITGNWRISANAARQEAVRTGTGQAGGAELLRLANNWLRPEVADGLLVNGGTGATSRFRTEQQLVAYQLAVASDGMKASELRKWRFNAVTNYTFDRESRFKGLGLGAALRWQDAVVIGYKAKEDPILGWISDVTQPVYGPTETITDAWVSYKIPRKLWKGVECSVQLNVRNIFDEDDLIPVYYNDPVTNMTDNVYRMQRGRDWFVTTKFKF